MGILGVEPHTQQGASVDGMAATRRFYTIQEGKAILDVIHTVVDNGNEYLSVEVRGTIGVPTFRDLITLFTELEEWARTRQ